MGEAATPAFLPDHIDYPLVKELKNENTRLKCELRRTRKAYHDLWMKVQFANWSAAKDDIPEPGDEK